MDRDRALSGRSSHFDYLRVRHLKFVLLLAEQGSLAAAAERLSLTPSAASMMLKEVEQLIGVKLFVRAGRGMAPTAFGRSILPRCRSALGEISAIGDGLDLPAAPSLRIGMIPQTATTLLPQIVQRLTLGQPSWRLQLRESNVETLLRLLRNAEIDLMIGRMPAMQPDPAGASELVQRPLYRSTLSIVCGRDNRLLKAKALTLKDVQSCRWILPAPESVTRRALNDSFAHEGLQPPVPVVEVPSFGLSLSVISTSDFLTCGPTSVVPVHPTARILPITLTVSPTPVAAIWRRSSEEAANAMRRLTALKMPG